MTREERARRIGQAIGEILVHLDVLRTPEGGGEAPRDVEAEFTERELSSAEKALQADAADPEDKPRPPGRESEDLPGEELPDDVLMETAGFGSVDPGVEITPV